MSILEVKNLTKKYGDFVAVNDISFQLKEGEILGLLGPNGAGKTTTLQMLLGVLTPTAGEIYYFGQNFKEHKGGIADKINFSSTYVNLPWILTVGENLKIISYLYTLTNRKDRVAEMVRMFKLDDLLNRRVEDLSAGQMTRLGLAKAFLNNPKVLLLDEPTASLDPDAADYVRKFILEQKEKHTTSIVITSHNMAEVEEICDRVIFINKGIVIADDTPENLARTVRVAHLKLLVVKNLDKIEQYCRDQNLPCEVENNFITVRLDEKAIRVFLEGVVTLGAVYEEISIDRPTLEDYFLSIVRKR